MADIAYKVRPMTKEDVPQALDIWKETKMQEGTHCLYTWLEVDPLSLNVAVTESGEVLGVCSAVIHHDDMVFVGIYVVREKYRGLGIGFKVWSACMEHIGTRNTALNAVPAKLELYREKGGFPLLEEDWVCRANETEAEVNPGVLLEAVPGISIKTVEDADLPSILEYDFNLMGYKRDLGIKLTIKETDSKSFAGFKNGVCVGFGTIKKSILGMGLVGPLYADATDIAEVLLRRLVESLPGVKGLAIITVSNNTGAKSIVDKLGVPMIDEYPRLYRKQKMNVDTNKVFAQLDLNFSPF